MRPEEIEQREFAVSMRGFDKNEVRAFLRRVAGDIRDLDGRLGDDPVPVYPIEQDILITESVDDRFGALGDRIANLLRQAYESANQIRETANEEAELLRADGQADLEAAQAEAAQDRAEAERIRSQAEIDAVEIRDLAERQGAARLDEREAEVERSEVEMAAERERSRSEVADAREQVADLLREARSQSEFIRHEADEIIRQRVRTNVDQAQKRIDVLRNTELASRDRIVTAQRELDAALLRLDSEDVPGLGDGVENEVLAEAQTRAEELDYGRTEPADPTTIDADRFSTAFADAQVDNDVELEVEIVEVEVSEIDITDVDVTEVDVAGFEATEVDVADVDVAGFEATEVDVAGFEATEVDVAEVDVAGFEVTEVEAVEVTEVVEVTAEPSIEDLAAGGLSDEVGAESSGSFLVGEPAEAEMTDADFATGDVVETGAIAEAGDVLETGDMAEAGNVVDTETLDPETPEFGIADRRDAGLGDQPTEHEPSSFEDDFQEGSPSTDQAAEVADTTEGSEVEGRSQEPTAEPGSSDSVFGAPSSTTGPAGRFYRRSDWERQAHESPQPESPAQGQSRSIGFGLSSVGKFDTEAPADSPSIDDIPVPDEAQPTSEQPNPQGSETPEGSAGESASASADSDAASGSGNEDTVARLVREAMQRMVEGARRSES